jgi:hypothetical protein
LEGEQHKKKNEILIREKQEADEEVDRWSTAEEVDRWQRTAGRAGCGGVCRRWTSTAADAAGSRK